MQNDNVNFEIILFGILFFGLFGMAESSWAVTSYYCSTTAKGTHDGLSWDNAWACASYATNPVVWGAGGVVAGDSLYIDGGPSGLAYTATSDYMLNIGTSGTSGNRITIATGAKSPYSSGHDGKVTFDGNGQYHILISGGNYTTLDGEKSGTQNWRFYNTKLGDTYTPIFFPSAIEPIMKYLEVEKVNTAVNHYAGTGGEYSHLYLHDIRGACGLYLVNTNSGTSSWDLTLIHDNFFNFNRDASGGEGPDGIQGARGMSVYNNTFQYSLGSIDAVTQHPDGIQNEAPYIKVYNNVFRNTADSAFDNDGAGAQGHVHIYNNLFVSDSSFSASVPTFIRFYSTQGGMTSLTDVLIYGNTFVDMVTSDPHFVIYIEPASGAAVSNVSLRNNLFYNSGKTGYYIVDLSNSSNYDVDYNLQNGGLHGGSGIALNGSLYTQAHGQTGVPAFVSYSERSLTNDFRLASGDTAAKDNGGALGSPYDVDILGLSRPQGSAWDIGAYEYLPGGDSTPPAAPSGLTVN